MKRLPIDGLKGAAPPASPIVEATLELVRDVARRRLAEWPGDWASFAAEGADALVTAADIAEVERKLLASGHRFDWSASISAAERPDAYKPVDGDADSTDFSFEHPQAATAPADGAGREQRGIGDNVVRHDRNVVGTARYIRSNARVLAYLTDGVPPNTIAVIDDSGGTLTAPIIEQFAGVICAGGSVRSHLGILSREYGIPCLMNARVSGIRDGDRVEIEATAQAKTTEDYQTGTERVGRIWRLAGEGAR
jgi:phosphohistidine swiveling domain-containing protein